MLKTMIYTAIAAFLAVPAIADASPKKPFHPRLQRSTELALEGAGVVHRVERARTLGRRAIRFVGESAAIEPGAVMLFEVHTEANDGSTLRWRCVAVADVSDCLGNGVRIAWAEHDYRAVLTVQLEPIATELGSALLAEARTQPPISPDGHRGLRLTASIRN